jgi:hypothetical protein
LRLLARFGKPLQKGCRALDFSVVVDKGDVYETTVGPVAVFPEIDALPGTKRQAALPHRKCQLRTGQHRTNVGRHIIRAFHAVRPGWIPILHQAAHEIFQVSPDIGIGVFRDEQ